MDTLKEELQATVLTRTDFSRDVADEELLELIQIVIHEKSKASYINTKYKQSLEKEIFNSLRRYDVLQELLEDPSVTEIMVNGADTIFIERDGALTRWQKHFDSSKKLEDVAQLIASSSNRIINEVSPIVDARLANGSRVNIVLPPIALNGPIITIRKFPDNPITMAHLIQIGAITDFVSSFLEKLVISGYNIFISGGTGSGKTTFLNVLSNYIPVDERIITIEDSAELQIKNIPNLVRLETRNANIEGKHEITIRELIKTAMRMRPTRLIVGEVRDSACIDMLQSLNTGHSGMSTGHANSPKDLLSRLETLVLLGADIPLLAVRKQIASAIDLIIHLGRLRDKSRRILDIVEVLECVDGEIELNPLFHFQEGSFSENHVIGSLVSCKNPLINTYKLSASGIGGDEIEHILL